MIFIDSKDLRVDVLMRRRNGQITFPDTNQFVKIEHVPSKIVVTKHSTRSQIRARDEAMEELKMLVEIWEGNG